LIIHTTTFVCYGKTTNYEAPPGAVYHQPNVISS